MAVVIIISSLALTSCSATNTTSKVSVTSVAPSPSQSASSEAGALSAQESAVLDKYDAMPISAFAALPKAEQGIYAYLTLQRGLPGFVSAWYTTSKDDRDAAAPASSESSAAIDIIRITGWERRYIWALAGDQRAKYLLAIFNDGAASPLYAQYKLLSDREATPTSPGVLAYDKALPWPQSQTSITAVMRDPAGGKYENVSFVDFDGTAGQRTFYLETIAGVSTPGQLWIDK
jgi:hypothetical protein